MIDCFGEDTNEDTAKECREWLQSPMGKPFWAFIDRECQIQHDGAVNALTDNPFKDILVGQRAIAAEQALLSLKLAVESEIATS